MILPKMQFFTTSGCITWQLLLYYLLFFLYPYPSYSFLPKEPIDLFIQVPKERWYFIRCCIRFSTGIFWNGLCHFLSKASLLHLDYILFHVFSSFHIFNHFPTEFMLWYEVGCLNKFYMVWKFFFISSSLFIFEFFSLCSLKFMIMLFIQW